MRKSAAGSLSWSPTIGLSWLWGLGFFYSIHVTLTYGWLGFLSFAIPNALGLALFGYAVGSPRVEVDKVFAQLRGGYAGLLLLCQVGAVGVTLFGFAAYLLVPLGLDPVGATVLLVLIACAVGQAASLPVLKRLHGALLVVGVAAAAVAWWGLQGVPHAPVPLFATDGRFAGLLLPTLAGFLLGPWLDVQQWHRAVEIRRQGGSPRLAYAGGAAVFAGVLGVNALLAAAAGPGFATAAADGVGGAQPSVTLALQAHHLTLPLIAFGIWVAVAAITTLDSFYVSTRWMTGAVLRASLSPLLAFVPAALVGSPLWIVLLAGVAAGALLAAHLSMAYFMVPFATAFVGAGTCLVAESLGVRRRYDPTLCALVGLASALVFLMGYLQPVPLLMTLAPVLGLLGALPMLREMLGGRRPVRPATIAPSPAVPTPARASLGADQGADQGASFGFDGFTFVMRMTPTYDDTNSVGNVYFANYMRWVGKARELFFNICMPDFDPKTTDFFILTRSFRHDFRREAREFEPVTVRINIARYNRKFVTLDHEIHSDLQGLLGRGEQSLMFVDRLTYRPLDIPRQVMDGFLPYWSPTASVGRTGDLGGEAA